MSMSMMIVTHTVVIETVLKPKMCLTMEITMANTIPPALFKTIKLILRLLLAMKEFINRQSFSES